MKYKLFISLIVVANISCTNQIFRATEYIAKTQNRAFESILEISDNHKFQYSYSSDLLEQKSYGKWARHKNKLILNSDSTLKVGIISIEHLNNSPEKQIKIKLIDSDEHPIAFRLPQISRH